MRLRGLGVIADAVLEFGPGLTVVTGETGAGKTMVVTGLGLLLGGRSDAGAVRTGATSALVEGRLAIGADSAVAERAREAGAELDPLDDGTAELIVSRSVSAEGRSRSHVGGRSTPVGVLADLADDLVAVHGQSEQLRLRSTARQRETLDRFAGAAVGEPLAAYRDHWQRLKLVEAELHDIRTLSRERAQEAELLRLGLAEVERLDPRPGEDTELRAESQRLGHAEDLRAAASAAQVALSGDEEATGSENADALTLLGRARQVLDQVRAHDPELAGLADRLAELAVLLGDVAAECAGYAQDVEADPARLAAVEQRRAELAGLTRAYGEDVDAVLDWARTAGLRLLELDGDEDRSAALVVEREHLRAALADLAGQVARARDAAAADLAAAVTAELAELAMPDAVVQVEVRRRPDEHGLPVDVGSGAQPLAAGPDGVDEVEFLLVPHAGAPARPLAKGASGGELSRVMLGLEVVLGGVDPVPTFVFDEVDAGVGGRAALGIGRRLARLARTAQVLVVTHLPQVAAYADGHLVVTKSSTGEVTESDVVRLDDAGRVRELARMLGGMADSGSAQAHAEELLTTARSERGTIVG